MKKRVSVRNFVRLLLIDAVVLVLLRVILGLSGCFDQRAQRANSDRRAVSLPVLMYHSIRRGPESDYAVTPDTLEEDLAYMQRLGWQTVSSEQICNYVFHGDALPDNPVLLTFDDGFYNNLAYALPLLEKYDMCATVNVVGEFTQILAEADSHSAVYSYLTADDLRTMLESGQITLGNHTTNLHHQSARMGCRIMPNEPEDAYSAVLRADIGSLQTYLAQETGISPIVFAYPYGFDCPESVPILRELGFLITLSCREGVNILTDDPECLYGLRRYNRFGYYTTEGYFSHIIDDFP